MASTQDCPVVVKRQRRPFSSSEKTMILNMYNTFLEATPNASSNDILKTVASSMGVHWASVYKIVKEKNTVGVLRSPKKEKPRPTVIEKTDSFTKSALRNAVHDFFRRNEIPTLDKICKAVNTDGTLGTFKRSSLHKLLRSIGFKFSKRSRNSMLTERDDIFFWRRNYLRAIRDARLSGNVIYYLDETWVNAGHTTNNVWIDTTVQSARSAFLNGLTTGLKNPSGELYH